MASTSFIAAFTGVCGIVVGMVLAQAIAHFSGHGLDSGDTIELHSAYVESMEEDRGWLEFKVIEVVPLAVVRREEGGQTISDDVWLHHEGRKWRKPGKRYLPSFFEPEPKIKTQ